MICMHKRADAAFRYRHRAINLSFTVFTSLFMMIYMVKMSHNTWSVLPDEQERTEVTLMDREVAAGWFDKVRPDANFRFRPYVHNVPNRDSFLESQRDSDIGSDGWSSDDEGHRNDIVYDIQ